MAHLSYVLTEILADIGKAYSAGEYTPLIMVMGVIIVFLCVAHLAMNIVLWQRYGEGLGYITFCRSKRLVQNRKYHQAELLIEKKIRKGR